MRPQAIADFMGIPLLHSGLALSLNTFKASSIVAVNFNWLASSVYKSCENLNK